MIAVNPNGSGPRGKLIAVAAFVLVVSLALVLGGCGDSANEGTTGSQLDDQSAGASTGTTTVGGAGSTGGSTTGGASQGNAMADYPMNQCVVDMTKRYGDEATAQKVCSGLQTNYGSSPMSQLATLLPPLETQVGATPQPGSTIPTTPGGTTGGGTGGNTGGNTGNSGSGGWDSGGMEIVVPGGPGGAPAGPDGS